MDSNKQFEWDNAKNALKKKHGISFETAAMVFQDPYMIEFFYDENSIDEERYDAIGMVDDVLFVVYTERTDRIRIISARIANERERRLYDAYYRNAFTGR